MPTKLAIRQWKSYTKYFTSLRLLLLKIIKHKETNIKRLYFQKFCAFKDYKPFDISKIRGKNKRNMKYKIFNHLK